MDDIYTLSDAQLTKRIGDKLKLKAIMRRQNGRCCKRGVVKERRVPSSAGMIDTIVPHLLLKL